MIFRCGKDCSLALFVGDQFTELFALGHRLGRKARILSVDAIQEFAVPYIIGCSLTLKKPFKRCMLATILCLHQKRVPIDASNEFFGYE